MTEEDTSPDRFIPLQVMPFVCSYLSSRDIERLRRTCKTLRFHVDERFYSLPKQIEQCDLKVGVEHANMNFSIIGGCNEPTKVTPNGFTISSFTRNGWIIEKSNKYHVSLTREIDDEFWDSVCDGFSLAIFDGFNVDMPLTGVNVNGLCHAMRSARFDEFRIAISKFESMEIGSKLSDLIGSRINNDRELSHLTYAIMSLKGDSFNLAADFIISLAGKVPSLEVEYCEKFRGWNELLTMDHLIRLQQSACSDLDLNFLELDNLTPLDIDTVLKLFLSSTFSRILKVTIPDESLPDQYNHGPFNNHPRHFTFDSTMPNAMNSELEIIASGSSHRYMKLSVAMNEEYDE